MEILKDVNFVQALIAVLLAYVGWTLRESHKSFKACIKDLYEKYGVIDARVTRVETVHNVKGCDTGGGKKQ